MRIPGATRASTTYGITTKPANPFISAHWISGDSQQTLALTGTNINGRLFLDLHKSDVELPLPDSPVTPRAENELILFVDGFDDCILRDYVPWVSGEASTLTGGLTDRMRRARREILTKFLKRTFTTNIGEACMHSSH